MVDIFDKTCDPTKLNELDISCLLYADDLILISESEFGLQKCLDKLYTYCEKWNLAVNLDKTNVMVFNKSGRILNTYSFKFNDQVIELTSEYKYLGILFKPSGIFTNAINLLGKKASKAMFCIRKLLYSDRLNVLPYLKLFETCIKPILLYCSEVWAPDLIVKDKSSLESKFLTISPVKFQIKFAKYVLGVNKSAVNTAVLAELGMFPIAIDALKASVGFWFHLVNAKEHSFVMNAYKCSLNLANSFAAKMKRLFLKLGFDHIWDNQNSFSKKKLIKAIGNKMSEKYVDFWKNSPFNDQNNPNGNKLRTYRKLKKDYELEKYLLIDTDRCKISNFVKLKISNSKLYIEQGRHRNIPLDKRLCPLCKIEIEDEFHFMLKCIKLADCRQRLFNQIATIIPSLVLCRRKKS